MKKDALLQMGMVDPGKEINPISTVNPNIQTQLPPQSNTMGSANPVFSDKTQFAANAIYGSDVNRQESMSGLSSMSGLPKLEDVSGDGKVTQKDKLIVIGVLDEKGNKIKD